jgi:hypothetical protein
VARHNVNADELNGMWRFAKPGLNSAGSVRAPARLKLESTVAYRRGATAEPTSVPALDIAVEDLEIAGGVWQVEEASNRRTTARKANGGHQFQAHRARGPAKRHRQLAPLSAGDRNSAARP